MVCILPSLFFLFQAEVLLVFSYTCQFLFFLFLLLYFYSCHLSGNLLKAVMVVFGRIDNVEIKESMCM